MVELSGLLERSAAILAELRGLREEVLAGRAGPPAGDVPDDAFLRLLTRWSRRCSAYGLDAALLVVRVAGGCADPGGGRCAELVRHSVRDCDASTTTPGGDVLVLLGAAAPVESEIVARRIVATLDHAAAGPGPEVGGAVVGLASAAEGETPRTWIGRAVAAADAADARVRVVAAA